MSLTGFLTIDLDAIIANWRALAALAPEAEAAAVVKADGYGCGIARVGLALARSGCRSFLVAQPGEGATLRAALGPGPTIHVLSGWPVGAPEQVDTMRGAGLTPVLNAPGQVAEWAAAGAPGQASLQLDTGMNRLGLEPAELAALRPLPPGIALVMSHLACADEPEHPMNAAQCAAFAALTADLGLPRSLAATGGILLGPRYHFDLVRPGVGLYGGLPFAQARPVVRLDLPILQVRDLTPGETVGYGATWTAARPSRIATVSGGYADGLIRAMGPRASATVAGRLCPFAGRVSMDLVTLDVTDCPQAAPGMSATLIDAVRGVDSLAEAAGTIGYEILTSLGSRYARHYTGG